MRKNNLTANSTFAGRVGINIYLYDKTTIHEIV